MNIEITYELDNGAFPPERAYEADAGYDIRTPKAFWVDAHGHATIDTGIHVFIPSGHVGMIKSKSGLNVHDDIVTEGVVDALYTGSIKVKLYNHGDYNKHFDKGDKITQLVIMPIPNVTMVEGKMPDDTERGSNGFGSTGR